MQEDELETLLNSGSAWAVLGVAPTRDLRAVKRGYAARIKTMRPEDNPAGFQAVREAYDWLCQNLDHYTDDELAEESERFATICAPEDSTGRTPSADSNASASQILPVQVLPPHANSPEAHTLFSIDLSQAVISPGPFRAAPIGIENLPPLPADDVLRLDDLVLSPSTPETADFKSKGPNNSANENEQGAFETDLDAPQIDHEVPALFDRNQRTQQTLHVPLADVGVLLPQLDTNALLNSLQFEFFDFAYAQESRQQQVRDVLLQYLRQHPTLESLQLKDLFEHRLRAEFEQDQANQLPASAIIAAADFFNWYDIHAGLSFVLDQKLRRAQLLAELRQESTLSKSTWANATAKNLMYPINWTKRLAFSLVPGHARRVEQAIARVEAEQLMPESVFHSSAVAFERAAAGFGLSWPRAMIALTRCVVFSCLIVLFILGVQSPPFERGAGFTIKAAAILSLLSFFAWGIGVSVRAIARRIYSEILHSQAKVLRKEREAKINLSAPYSPTFRTLIGAFALLQSGAIFFRSVEWATAFVLLLMLCLVPSVSGAIGLLALSLVPAAFLVFAIQGEDYFVPALAAFALVVAIVWYVKLVSGQAETCLRKINEQQRPLVLDGSSFNNRFFWWIIAFFVIQAARGLLQR